MAKITYYIMTATALTLLTIAIFVPIPTFKVPYPPKFHAGDVQSKNGGPKILLYSDGTWTREKGYIYGGEYFDSQNVMHNTLEYEFEIHAIDP